MQRPSPATPDDSARVTRCTHRQPQALLATQLVGEGSLIIAVSEKQMQGQHDMAIL
jgi:hypothetical protein